MQDVAVTRCYAELKDGKAIVSFELKNTEDVNAFTRFTDKRLVRTLLNVEKYTPKSKSLNSYLWVLCDRIADEINKEDGTAITKIDIYRHAIREAGVWTDLAIPKNICEEVLNAWSNNGLGWFSERISEEEDEFHYRMYKGIKVYTGNELLKLTRYIVEMANEKGIETATEKELFEMEKSMKAENTENVVRKL